MSKFKFYTRRIPENVRARVLDADEIVYDAMGRPVGFRPGDILVDSVGRFSPYVMDAQMFYQIYMEVPSGDQQGHDQDVSQTELPDVQQR